MTKGVKHGDFNQDLVYLCPTSFAEWTVLPAGLKPAHEFCPEVSMHESPESDSKAEKKPAQFLGYNRKAKEFSFASKLRDCRITVRRVGPRHRRGWELTYEGPAFGEPKGTVYRRRFLTSVLEHRKPGILLPEHCTSIAAAQSELFALQKRVLTWDQYPIWLADRVDEIRMSLATTSVQSEK